MFTIPPEVRYSSLATPNSYTLRTSNFYGVFGGLDAVDTSAGSITETLPLNPNIGAWLVTADLAGTWATNPLVLDGNGQMILGAYSNIDCDLSNSVVTLIFVGGTVGWQLYISHLSTGGGVVPGQQLFDNTPALFLDAGARQLFGTDGVTPLIDLNLTTTGYADFPQGLSAGGGFITTCYSGGYITTNNYGGSIDTSNSGGYIDTSNGGAGIVTASYTPSAGWLFAFDGSNMVPTDPTGFTVGTANYATNAYGLIDPSTATGFTPDSMGNFSTPGGIGIFSAAALTSQPAAIANSDPITVSDKLNALLAVMRNYGFIAT